MNNIHDLLMKLFSYMCTYNQWHARKGMNKDQRYLFDISLSSQVRNVIFDTRESISAKLMADMEPEKAKNDESQFRPRRPQVQPNV